IEELARIYGYQNIDEKNEIQETKLFNTSKRLTRNNHINSFMVSSGYSEVINYSFISPSMDFMMGKDSKSIHIKNPLSIEMSVMRTSLLPGLLKNLVYNLQRQHENIKLFESGKIFTGDQKLDREKDVIAGICYGSRVREQWGFESNPIDFYDVKGDLDSFFMSLKMKNQITYIKDSHPMLGTNKNAKIDWNATTIGHVGELDPELAMELNIAQSPILFEIDKDYLKLPSQTNYQDCPYFPSSRRDISLVILENQETSVILKIIQQLEIPILKELIIFDIYKGKNIESGRISVALGLIFQAKSRTLT
ncbi:uncharacterized protein METZ01_LOCUS368756, partial [marine metagenome]